MREKGFINVLFILAVCVVIIGLFSFALSKIFLSKKGLESPVALSPTPTPVQYLIYKEEEIGFSFQYPPKGFKVIEDGEKEYFERSKSDFRKFFSGYVGYEPPKFIKGLSLIKEGQEIKSQFDLIPLTVWVFENPGLLTIQRWYDKYWYYPFVWGQFAQPFKGKVEPTNVSTISGHLAKYSVVPYQPGTPKFKYLQHQDKMLLVKIINSEEGDLGDKVIETLTFD